MSKAVKERHVHNCGGWCFEIRWVNVTIVLGPPCCSWAFQAFWRGIDLEGCGGMEKMIIRTRPSATHTGIKTARSGLVNHTGGSSRTPTDFESKQSMNIWLLA